MRSNLILDYSLNALVSDFPLAEEFNSKILTPELLPSQLDELHVELKDLYTMYCDEDAFDRIHFDDDILQQLKLSTCFH